MCESGRMHRHENRVLAMRQVVSVVDRRLRQVAKEAGLTLDGALVLAWMVDRPGLRLARIAEGLGRSRANVLRTLRQLEARELARGLPCPITGKTVGWTTTAEGAARFQKLENWARAVDSRLIDRWPAVTPHALGAMERLLREMYETPTGDLGLVVPPYTRKEPDVLPWDL